MNTTRFEQLLIAYEDDLLTPEELAEFKHLLAASPAARRRLVEAGVLRQIAACHVMPETIIEMPQRKRSAWIQWRPLTAAAAGIVFGMFCVSVAWAIASPQAVATVSQLFALVDGSFEKADGRMPSGFPAKFSVWSGEETEIVGGGSMKVPDGGRMLRFVRSSERPAMANSCDIYQLIDLRSLGISQQDGESSLELSARFLDGRTAAGDPLRFILRLYVFSGSPDSLREKWPLTWKNAMTLPEALSSGNTLIQIEGKRPNVWRDVKAKALLPPNAEFALVHVGVYSPKAPSGASVEYGNQFVDDVRLMVQTQPVLPVRLVQR